MNRQRVTDIGIFGDSWGIGVWGQVEGNDPSDLTHYGIVHLGIQHYLWKTEYRVTNFSVPGFNNNLILEDLKKYHQNFNINIVIVTEPFRDFFSKPHLYDSNKTFKQNCEQLVDSQLKEIETLCGESCIVVGGCHKISKNYNFMHTVNWCELIDSSVDWPVYYADAGQLGQKLKQNEIIINGPKIKEVILDEEAYDRHRKIRRDLQDKYFTRCGHPNIRGHEILYKEIQRVIS